MHEEYNQKISQLLDNELTQSEALSLLKSMQLQPELLNKLNRYEAISHALKTEVFLLAKTDFSANVSQQIQHEPNYLLPQRQRFQYGYKMLALAASVAAVAVIASWDVIQHQTPGQSLQSAFTAKAPAPQAPPNQDIQIAQQKPSELAPLNQRINDYLQAHNNSVYTNGEANFKPFTRVTAYSRE
ncbi:MAG: sigma-E factor negative regulatory protein [Methylococcales bacterium]